MVETTRALREIVYVRHKYPLQAKLAKAQQLSTKYETVKSADEFFTLSVYLSHPEDAEDMY